MRTKDRLLVSAASLFAERGFHGVGIEELSASVGLTGPALYRHFRTKNALLAAMLISVSESLVARAEEVIERDLSPRKTLQALIDRHLDFTLNQPDLIRVHERDFANLDEEDARTIRRLQRKYVEIWVDQLQAIYKEDRETSRAKAHAVFGLLNSTPRIKSASVRPTLQQLAENALLG